jgi:SepF-like predicted cell division protein (DUF552 family)
MANFVGEWTINDIPEEFEDMLRILGYNALERRYAKNAKIRLLCDITNNNIMTIRTDSTLYKKTREYDLSGTPIESKDEKKNSIIETTRLLDPNTMETKSVIVNKNITIVDTRRIRTGNRCHQKIIIMSPEEDMPLEMEVTYMKK